MYTVYQWVPVILLHIKLNVWGVRKRQVSQPDWKSLWTPHTPFLKMWNPFTQMWKKNKKQTPLGNRKIKRLFLSHQWGTGYSWCVRKVFFFFFSWVNKLRPELWLHQSPSHEHWRGMRGTRQQSHQLWQIPIYEQMLTQRWIEGGKKWRQTGAEAFCFPPRCCDLTWARRHWYICSPAKLASLRLSDSTGIHVVWQRMHKQQEIWG